MMKGKQVLILLLEYHPPGGVIDTKPKYKEHKASKRGINKWRIEALKKVVVEEIVL